MTRSLSCYLAGPDLFWMDTVPLPWFYIANGQSPLRPGQGGAVILEFLSAHGEVPVELQKRITWQTDISILRSWTHIAAHCDSIADFIDKTMI